MQRHACQFASASWRTVSHDLVTATSRIAALSAARDPWNLGWRTKSTVPENIQSVPEEASIIPPHLEGKLLRVRETVTNAREAVVIASVADSDDWERDRATSFARYAIQSYEELLTSSNKEENQIAALLEDDIKSMKEELYKARWQRVWIGWYGWF